MREKLASLVIMNIRKSQIDDEFLMLASVQSEHAETQAFVKIKLREMMGTSILATKVIKDIRDNG